MTTGPPHRYHHIHYGYSELIHLRLESRSAMPAYAQLVQQVRAAVLRGVLVPGDRLPSAREVVRALAINPNTVLKAYAQLEHDGFAFSRAGQGTFIADTAPEPIASTIRRNLEPALQNWMRRAQNAGLTQEAVSALLESAVDATYRTRVA